MERIKAESAEAAQNKLEEMQKKTQQMLEEKEKSYQEHLKQLTDKMDKERAQLMAEHEKALNLKLQVFYSVIAILSSTALGQKRGLDGRASCQIKGFCSPNTSRHFIFLLLLSITVSG